MLNLWVMLKEGTLLTCFLQRRKSLQWVTFLGHAHVTPTKSVAVCV